MSSTDRRIPRFSYYTNRERVLRCTLTRLEEESRRTKKVEPRREGTTSQRLSIEVGRYQGKTLTSTRPVENEN